MVKNPKYAHTNIIAEDWRSLADFYRTVLGCIPVPPERDLGGAILESGTGVRGASIRGVHLRLPGYGEDGPTLEIFTYHRLEERPKSVPNRLGIAHLAFSVDNVAAARDEVLRAGGRCVGEIVSTQGTGGGKVTWCYVTDPEGNILELQKYWP